MRTEQKLVLNVGSAGSRDLPPVFANWQQTTLDIDPRTGADIIADALELRRLPPSTYNAVYCSHCLEHFPRHEVRAVLAGFHHVLKPAGFTYLRVPDIAALVTELATRDIDDVWYISQGGPITFHDVLYGWGRQLAAGNKYYAHKSGFTELALTRELSKAGFPVAMIARDLGELHAYGFKVKPTARQLRSLQLCR